MGPRSVLSGRDLYIIYVAGHPKNYKDVRMRHAKGGMRMHFYKIVHFFITPKITKKIAVRTLAWNSTSTKLRCYKCG